MSDEPKNFLFRLPWTPFQAGFDVLTDYVNSLSNTTHIGSVELESYVA